VVSRSRESGIALIVALLLLVLVTMSLLAVAGYVQGRVNAFQVEQRTVILTALADAAMAETLAGLQEDEDFEGIDRRQFGAGSIASTVVRSQPSTVEVMARGRITGWQATIEARVELTPAGPRVASWAVGQGPE